MPVLMNVKAGRPGASARERLEDELAAVGGAAEILSTPPDRIRVEVARLVEEGVSVVGVAGGDGTLRAAAEELAGGEAALLPIPTGTVNTFCRRAGIPDMASAAAALASGELGYFPVGFVGERLFLNTATFGFYAGVVRRRERIRPLIGKWPAASVAFLASTLTMREMEVSIDAPSEHLSRRTPVLWVGLGWGSFPQVDHALERRSTPDLELAILRNPGRIGMMRLAARTLVGIVRGEVPVRDRALEVVHGRSFVLDARGDVDTTLDGEVFRLGPPLLVSVQDRGLRVLRPRRAGAERT